MSKFSNYQRFLPELLEVAKVYPMPTSFTKMKGFTEQSFCTLLREAYKYAREVGELPWIDDPDKPMVFAHYVGRVACGPRGSLKQNGHKEVFLSQVQRLTKFFPETLDEVRELTSWVKKGLLKEPIVVAFGGTYGDSLEGIHLRQIEGSPFVILDGPIDISEQEVFQGPSISDLYSKEAIAKRAQRP